MDAWTAGFAPVILGWENLGDQVKGVGEARISAGHQIATVISGVLSLI